MITLQTIIHILAIIGGIYSLYRIVKGLWKERADLKRINALVEGDMLPISMKDKAMARELSVEPLSEITTSHSLSHCCFTIASSVSWSVSAPL